MLLLSSANPVDGRFARYKQIEAYEIRPDILMMPSYTSDGQICEIGLEKRQYSPAMVRLEPSLTRRSIRCSTSLRPRARVARRATR